MDFSTLTYLIRHVTGIATDRRVLVFGSSSLFASFADDPPALLGVDVTKDADFFFDPDDTALRGQLQESMGRDRPFHDASGVYGDFVDLRLADAFPTGWKDRLVPMPGFENVFALEPVDMCVTKIAATANSRLSRRMGRGGVDRGMKDINTIVALLKAERIDREALIKRLHGMDYEPALTVECAQVLEEILAIVGKASIVS